MAERWADMMDDVDDHDTAVFITIKHMETFTTITTSFNAMATVSDLKHHIARAWGIPAEIQNITYESSVMEDNNLIYGYFRNMMHTVYVRSTASTPYIALV